MILLVVVALFIGVFVALSSNSGIETSTLSLSNEAFEYADTIREQQKRTALKVMFF